VRPEISDAERAPQRVNRNPRLCHGGPISEPDDAAYILEQTGVVEGFSGASSIDGCLPRRR
jgi:predicted TIM-barrel enzyme